MSLALEEALGSRVADRGLSFVFPSQAAAEAWALASPRRFGLGAAESGRFLGWDRFKELFLSERRRERPAERLARTVWAAGILARQAERPFLRRIAGPGAPSPAFVPYFASLPPGLEGLSRALRGEAGGELQRRDEGLADLLRLREDYAAFLEAKGLFEPAWERLSGEGADGAGEAGQASPGGRRYLLIAPELIEDFDRYEEELRALPFLEILPLPPAPPPPPLLRFENLYEELRHAFLRIGELLDGGLGPEEIAVTLPELEAERPWLERAAALAGVPIAVRSGRSLASSPFGRLLREMGEAVAADFSFPSLRALLLDRFARFREAGLARGLVRFGVERHAYASYVSGGRRLDIWEESFRVSGDSSAAPLRSFYLRLRASLREISGAASFAELRRGITAFRAQFLDEEGWTEAERRLVERSMAELEALARAEAELGAAGRLPSPFALFLDSLKGLTYQPQIEARAVSVYPYRVSALLPARVHFLLGASQEGLAVAYDRAPFLGEHQKEALGLGDRDATEDFARAYLLSGGELVASYAVEGASGWAAPHPFFPEPAPPPGLGALLEADPLRGEAAAFREEAPLPSRLLRLQRESLLAALPSLAEAPRRYAEGLLAGEAARALVLGRASRQDGLLRLSATHLAEYRSCPFAWLLGRALRLEEEPSGIDFFDARLAGQMAHEAIRRLLSAIGGLGPLDPLRIEEYRALAREALAAVLPDFEAAEGPFLRPMFEAYAPLLADRLERLLADLVEEAGWEAGELELALEKAYPELGAVLEGRIDRLARRGEARAIVDYKKRRLPRPAELLVSPPRGAAAGEPEGGASAAEEGIEAGEAEGGGGPGAGELGDFQIAAYVSLCEAAGLPVEKASYWSIEEARALRVLGPGGLKSREDYDPELAALDRALALAAAGLREGRLGPAGPGSSGCEGCAWKGVCRGRYATE